MKAKKSNSKPKLGGFGNRNTKLPKPTGKGKMSPDSNKGKSKIPQQGFRPKNVQTKTGKKGKMK